MPLYKTRENSYTNTFNLGQSPNEFGSTTSTKTEAEALRDAYTLSNSTWLASYDNNPSLSIKLVYNNSSEGANYIESQSRVNSEWATLNSVVALKGQDGGTTELIGVRNNHIPVKSSSGESFEDSGMKLMDDGTILTSSNFRAQSASIEVGNSVKLSEVGGALSSYSNATGNRYLIPFLQYSTSLGTPNRPFVLDASEGITDEMVQSDDSILLEDNCCFQLPSPANLIVNKIKFKVAEEVSNVAVRLKSVTNGDTVVKYLPNEATWINIEEGIYGDNGFDFTVGENTLDITSSPMLFITDPYTIDYEIDFISSGTIKLYGDGTVPYFAIDGNYFTVQELCQRNDIKEFFVYPKNGNAYEISNWNIEHISQNTDTHFIFKVPDNFNEIISCTVVVLPEDTETIRADIEVSISGIGLHYNDTENTVSNKALYVQDNYLNEFDITDLMNGIDNTKYIAIDFNSDTSYINVVGLNFKYR